MNTVQLECFLSVANYLNFSRAAEHLRITQPAVSHQIGSLEDELGVKLFHRTSKSVRLTQEGYLFTQYASEILRLTGLSRARLKESREAQMTHLGIGCRNTIEMQLVRPALARLRQEEPELTPLLRLIPFDSLENLLEEQDIQVMFSFEDSAPKRAVFRELIRCPVVCVCSEDHPLADRKEVTIQQLRNAGRMAISRPPSCPASIFAIQGQIIAKPVGNRHLFCDNLESVYTLVESGFAFAVMPYIPKDRISGLRYIPLLEVPALSFGVSYLSEKHSPVLRRFLDLLEESIQDATEKRIIDGIDRDRV